jgi:UDP-glucose 4-epimerase
MEGSRLQIYGDGLQTRDFTFVDNVVQANVAAATSVAAAGRIMNVACGERWSLLDLVSRLESVMQCDIATDFHVARAGDIKHSLASIQRARDLLGYAPAVDFDDGIRETVAWFFDSDRNAIPARRHSALASAVL